MSELHADDEFMYQGDTRANVPTGLPDALEDLYEKRSWGGHVVYPPDYYAEAASIGPELDIQSQKVDVEGNNAVDWDQAPDWANYWAMDSNGKAYWYAEYPILDLKTTDWESFDITDDAPDFGYPSELWDESLEKRPDEQEQELDEMVKDAEDLGLYDNEYCDNSSRLSDSLSKVKSDGGSTSYYDLPDHATELRHLISHKSMSKSRGDIFKACYRLDEKDGADALYDLNKMKFFVDDLIEMYHRGEHL